MVLNHFFTFYQSLGGVQSILKRHHREDHRRGHNSRFVIYFEKTIYTDPSITGLGLTWRDTIASTRQKFHHLEFPADSIAVCHNLWGLPFLADLMPAHRRVGLLHSYWTGLEKFIAAQRGLLDGVLCVSNPLVELVRHCMPELDGERVTLIPYPIDGMGLPPCRPAMMERPVVIGWTGRLEVEQKRVDRLPLLVAALESIELDFRLEILGAGPRESWLRRKLPPERVRFHGRKTGDAYWSALKGWDFIVSVSDYEGLPISMLEALSTGTLPICPKIGSGGDAYAGRLDPEFLYPPGDFKAAAKAVRTAVEKPETDLESLRQAAHAMTEPHSETNYFRTFDSFVEHIGKLPRVSQTYHPPRRFFFADHCPFGVLRRLWNRGSNKRNDK